MPPPHFLADALLARYTAPPPPTRPHVTLTFAQSLDAKIAGAAGAQLILSGAASMRMTHWIRTMHDAILVGIGTALNDDPQLNTRHLPPDADAPHLPRPVVLDTHLRLAPTCKLLVNFRHGGARRPWVLCAVPSSEDADWQARFDALRDAGATIFQVPSTRDDTGILRLPAVLGLLHAQGVRSLMVEGGARVIGSFFATPNCVDTVIITTAPTLVGENGVGYGVHLNQAGFKLVDHHLEGKDSVVVLVADSESS
ncbi:dihydrofolate reductase-like domain-containing protein [Mycena sp. CBHHK59/15]|nr:dihydrofolate reductase-like domain-containing protein [Mycena sp. CBHHK59/15]